MPLGRAWEVLGLGICGHQELWELGACGPVGRARLEQPSIFSQFSSGLQLTTEGWGAPWGRLGSTTSQVLWSFLQVSRVRPQSEASLVEWLLKST